MLTLQRTDDDIIRLTASGKLTKADYDRFVPEFERMTATGGPVRLLIELENFAGWELPAIWEDLKFDVRHQDDLGRVAIVGDKAWQAWGTRLSKPFFKADMRYFERDHEAKAKTWLLQEES
ncbi:MAG: STAS/SEC14 domain-containing protein [Alphaproteobacteria bacterium]